MSNLKTNKKKFQNENIKKKNASINILSLLKKT